MEPLPDTAIDEFRSLLRRAVEAFDATHVPTTSVARYNDLIDTASSSELSRFLRAAGATAELTSEVSAVAARRFLKHREAYDGHSLNAYDLGDDLRSGVLVMPGGACVDNTGAQVVVFSARKHSSKVRTADLMRYLIESATTTRITLVYDLTGAAWEHLDIGVQTRVFHGLGNTLPVSIHRILLVNAPWWIRLLIPALQAVVRGDILSRLEQVTLSQLHEVVSPLHLPSCVNLGGALDFNLGAFVKERERADSTPQGQRPVAVPGTMIVREHDGTDGAGVTTQESCVVRVSGSQLRYLKGCTGDASEGDLVMGDTATVVELGDCSHVSVTDTARSLLSCEEHIVCLHRASTGDKCLEIVTDSESERSAWVTRLREGIASVSDKRENTRRNIVMEILTTERTYVQTLEMVRSVFEMPLRTAYNEGHPVIDDKEIKSIFLELEGILQVNHALLDGLEKRINNWSPEQCVADVFQNVLAHMKVYSPFISNFPMAIDTIESLTENSSRFRKFLRERQQRPECRALGLSEHLLCPVQRIPRYTMLLADLAKRTPVAHKDYKPLHQTLGRVKELAEHLNTVRRESEMRLRAIAIQKGVKGLPRDFQVIQPTRRFVMESDCVELTGAGKKAKERRVRLHVFNDMVMVTAVKAKSKGDVELSFVTAFDTSSMSVAHCDDEEQSTPAAIAAAAEGLLFALHTPASGRLLLRADSRDARSDILGVFGDTTPEDSTNSILTAHAVRRCQTIARRVSSATSLSNSNSPMPPRRSVTPERSSNSNIQ